LSTLNLDKYPQSDFFICDVQDAILKDLMPTMEHPFYSLTKKPELAIRRYEHNGNYVEITPSVKGLATIYDKDILIYAVSQLMQKDNRNEPISPYIQINCYELLRFCNRGTGGKDYESLCSAIDRLMGTTISTNIVHEDGAEEYSTFGLIESAQVKRKNNEQKGRIENVKIKLSDWIFDAIKANKVKTLNRDYFRLKKPIERRVYEIATKHCGDKHKWSISLLLLHKKTGSRSNIRLFKGAIKLIEKENMLPDFQVEFDDDRKMVTFVQRKSKQPKDKIETDKKLVSTKTENLSSKEKRKKITAAIMDIHDTDW
jgi:plasmid replication initiation protein